MSEPSKAETERAELLALAGNTQGAIHLLRKAIHAGDPTGELELRCHDIWLDLESLGTRLAAAPPQPAPSFTEFFEACRKALTPFADFADPKNVMPSDFQITAGSGWAKRQLTMGDCYHAAAAIASLRSSAGPDDFGGFGSRAECIAAANTNAASCRETFKRLQQIQDIITDTLRMGWTESELPQRGAGGDVREALQGILVEDDIEEADDECELCGGRGTVDAYTDRVSSEGRDEIGCPACIERSHSRQVRAALAKTDTANASAEARLRELTEYVASLRRHQINLDLRENILKKIIALSAGGDATKSEGLCPVPPGKNEPVSTQTACDEGVSSDSAAARRMPDSESIGSFANAIATTQCEDSASPDLSDTPTPADDAAVAWVIPGDDNARDNGFIDAMAWREGEFTKPLYSRPAKAVDVEADRATFNEWFDRNFLDPDGSSHLPVCLKNDLWAAWRAALLNASDTERAR